MKISNRNWKTAAVFLALAMSLLLILPISSAADTPYPQYNVPYAYYGEVGFYVPTLNEDTCDAGDDFILQIPPGACSPMVVRSDLLEEQEVPVFCRLDAIKINPLIEIPNIQRIAVEQQTLDKNIKRITFHPARAGLKTVFSDLVSSPTLNNLGYLVVILKKQANEKDMPGNITANFTAKIKYDMQKSMGIAEEEIVSDEITDDSAWQDNYHKYSFWFGKGYVRVMDLEENRAKIAVYYNAYNNPVTSVTLSPGDESSKISMPGFYCSAGVKLKLNSIDYPANRAELVVNGDTLMVTEKSNKKSTKIKDSECTIKSIEPSIYGFGGKVKISCPGGTYTLQREAKTEVSLRINNQPAKTFGVGDEIADGLTLSSAYHKIGANGNKTNVIVVSETKDSAILKRIFKLIKAGLTQGNIQEALNKEVVKSWEVPGSLFIDKSDKTKKVYNLNIVVEKIEGLENQELDKTTKEYYDSAIDAYRTVAEFYYDVQDQNKNYLGAKALWEAAMKAREMNQTSDEASLFKEIMQRYPSTGFKDKAEKELNNLLLTADEDKATAYIVSNNKAYKISLADVTEPTEEELSADLSIDGKAVERHVLGSTPVANWTLDDIQENEIIFRNLQTGLTEKITKSYEKTLGTSRIKIVGINLKKQVHVSVLPWTKEGLTYSNFTFAVGIEKRAIKLSPEKTEEMIDTLNKRIAEWENAYNQINTFTQNWKKACFAGSFALWVSNFFDSMSGKAKARQMVMDGFGGEKGYIAVCEGEIAKGEHGKSLSKCLYDKRDEISKEIETVQSSASLAAQKIEDIKNNNAYASQVYNQVEKAFGIKLPKTINKAGLASVLKENVFSKYDIKGFEFINEIGNKETLTADDIKSALALSDNLKFESDMEDLISYLEIKKQCQSQSTKGVLCENINEILGRKLLDYKSTWQNESNKNNFFSKVLNEKNQRLTNLYHIQEKGTTTPVVEVFEANRQEWNLGGTGKAKLGLFSKGNFKYLVVLSSLGKDNYEISEIFIITDDLKVSPLTTIPAGIDKRVKGIGAESCSSSYKGELSIKFWETGQYEGLPALMPVDVEKGYYFASTTQKSGLEAYQESGKVSNFYLCHVGSDGLPDFDFGLGAGGDDKCILINPSGIQSEKLSLCGKDVSEYITKATGCVAEASKSFKLKKKEIATSCCKQCKIGAPAISTPSASCEDFMSPESCRIMYNLCDPVICPSSRCDLGGNYKVDDVVQTGVIGGLTLCFSNFPEVAFPFCLPAVSGGIDNIITVMKGGRDCLKESLATGKQIGICDQVTSIYWCEFFWKEITPFLKISLPKIAYGITHPFSGGGEYENFMSAWNSAEKSAQFFAEFYAKNSFNAFKIRSTAEIGTELCKGFVSLRYPSAVELFDELTKPESPYQINAWYGETPMTTATVPAMSAYNVYYHIYAGRDSGHNYQVYLTKAPSAGYYETPERYPVPEAMGYIPAGEFLDIKKDFTAAAGYTQLCVRIDAKDHCGFKKVTTTMGIDELTSYYISDQAANEVKSESECISGTSGLFPLAAITELNAQQAVEEFIEPGIYKRGIIRVCSTLDPGLGVEEGRWEQVGYCSETMKCWLDKKSVQRSIKDLGIQNETIEKAKQISDAIKVSEGFFSHDACVEKLEQLRKKIPVIEENIKLLIQGKSTVSASVKAQIDAELDKVIIPLKELVDKCVSETDRAQAQLEIGALYNIVVKSLKKEVVSKAESTRTGVVETTVDETLDILFDFDSYAVKAADKTIVENAIKSANFPKGSTIEIKGYASLEGLESYNFELSRNRAYAISNIIKPLVSQNTNVQVNVAGKGSTSQFSEAEYKDAAKIEFERINAITESSKRKTEAEKSTILSRDRRVTISYKNVKTSGAAESAAKTETKAEEAKEEPAEFVLEETRKFFKLSDAELKLIQEEAKKEVYPMTTILTYYVEEEESIYALTAKLYPAAEDVSMFVDRVKRYNPSIGNKISYTKVHAIFSDSEWKFFTDSIQEKQKSKSCGTCENNIINKVLSLAGIGKGCTKDDCLNLIKFDIIDLLSKEGTLKHYSMQKTKCFWIDKLIKPKLGVEIGCAPCLFADECGYFSDKQECENTECLRRASATKTLNCVWDDSLNECVNKDLTDSYATLLQKVDSEQDSLNKAQMLSSFISKSPFSEKSIEAFKKIAALADEQKTLTDKLKILAVARKHKDSTSLTISDMAKKADEKYAKLENANKAFIAFTNMLDECSKASKANKDLCECPLASVTSTLSKLSDLQIKFEFVEGKSRLGLLDIQGELSQSLEKTEPQFALPYEDRLMKYSDYSFLFKKMETPFDAKIESTKWGGNSNAYLSTLVSKEYLTEDSYFASSGVASQSELGFGQLGGSSVLPYLKWGPLDSKETVSVIFKLGNDLIIVPSQSFSGDLSYLLSMPKLGYCY